MIIVCFNFFTEHVRYFENYFDMPAAVLFARLIDLKDKEVIVINRIKYTAKLLFHQSPTRHSDYTVTTTVTM